MRFSCLDSSNKIGSTKVCRFNYIFLFLLLPFFFFLFKLFYKGDKSKRPIQWEGEQSERPLGRKLADDILSLQAEVIKLGKIVNERERIKQKESEELQRKMKEEWEEMKAQFQDMLNTKESKYQLAKIIGIRIPCF